MKMTQSGGWSLVLVMAAAVPAHANPAKADEDTFLRQSRGVNQPRDMDEWRKGEKRGGLKPYPAAPAGTPNPAGGLPQFGGSGSTSFSGPDLGEPFASFRARMQKQRAAVDRAARGVLESRFDLTCKSDPKITMSKSKPQPLGPTARLPKGMKSWEDYAAQSPDKVRDGDAFPYRPLDHPLHSTAHMVFPNQWTRVHPEHERFDVGMDIPDCFLPEFPPPLYLTTHPELGDVSRGVEITYGNYFPMFNGILTPEQMDGLRVLVTPFQTTWFNVTHHRVTSEPSEGVTCFSCHVNGHANGAIELAPDTRPNYARLRVDTPTMRGNYGFILFSSKRSIRTMDHFAEVEEYFDGDTTLLAAIGGRDLQKSQTNHVGDFNSIIDFPPAPKLDPMNRLVPEKSTQAELRGEKLFFGKGKCGVCHPAETYFQDNTMHDLQVERFYKGRAEGPIKTFALRGIKDTPPYLHDGRLLTLEDTVEFFNIVLQTRLAADEKKDLAAYLRAL
ncbi:MAG: snr1 [Myxococcales bacterium]|nr:snr1 [Myxococcales bacterium]